MSSLTPEVRAAYLELIDEIHALCDEILRLMRPYEQLGIPILYTSAETRAGLEALEPLLRDRLSFFWGGSGVGKSSLIRALTGLEVKVGMWRTDNPRARSAKLRWAVSVR